VQQLLPWCFLDDWLQLERVMFPFRICDLESLPDFYWCELPGEGDLLLLMVLFDPLLIE
jgi:hypothetical protein